MAEHELAGADGRQRNADQGNHGPTDLSGLPDVVAEGLSAIGEAAGAGAEVAGAGLEASAGCLEGCGAGCSLMVVGAVGLGFAAVRVLQILC